MLISVFQKGLCFCRPFINIIPSMDRSSGMFWNKMSRKFCLSQRLIYYCYVCERIGVLIITACSIIK